MHHSRALVELRSNLRNARERAGLSQAQVAELAGVRANDIGRCENGRHASPTLIAKTATALATFSTLTNGREPDPTVALELDERLEAAEKRLVAVELQLTRAGVELAYQRALIGAVD
jgi:transcriptional regulator with XRE-family HTH domain